MLDPQGLTWTSRQPWHARTSAGCQGRRHQRFKLDPWVGKLPLEKETAAHSSVLAWEIPWRGAWQVMVHGVAKALIQLSNLTARTPPPPPTGGVL